MAESIELRNESTIPELEEMERHQLFEPSEIKMIAKKRQELEYRLHRQTKNKEDCVRFIQFERNVLRMVRLRKQKNGLAQKKMNIEYSIAIRLNKLFNEAIRRFQDDVLIWLSYIKFCKQVRFFTTASRIFYQLLELHGKDKPVLYKLAATWELEECKCIDKARTFLLNGLQIHKDSRLLYTEAFKMELHYANERRNEAKANEKFDENDRICQGHHARVIYESAIKKVPDVSFMVELLEMAKKYDFTTALQVKILSDLESMFPSDEQTWDTIAKNKLTCVKDKKIAHKERIRQCVAVYKKYVRVLKSERMWSMYLDTLIDLYKDKTTYPNFKKNILSTALNSAHSADKLSENYYFVWVDLLKDVPEKAKRLNQILQQATNRLSNSTPLWETRIRIHLSRGEENLADEAFREANTALGAHALPIWKLMLLHYQAKNTAKAEEIFKEGVNGLQCPQISNTMKILYLERLAVTRGISAARKAYEQLATKPPLCLELHSKMAALESFQPEPSVKRARSCHSLACKQFGSNNTDVWMDYIKFETKHGDPSSVSSIYLKATNSLKKKSLVDSFISEYNLAKSNSTI